MKICTRTYKNNADPAFFGRQLSSRGETERPCIRRPDNSILCQDTLDSSTISPDLLGDEKELALMFLDIRNFTTFMESRSAYDVIYVIRKLFVLFAESIKEAGGRVVETAGDSIYAVFGLKGDIEKAVKASVDAAKAIFHDLEVFNSTYAQPYFNLNFEIGIGLHKGNVVVGRLALDYNEHLTVMGLPVNVTSRLQSKTKELNNNLLISEHAYAYLDEPDTHEQKTVHLKGITDGLAIRLMGQPYANKPQEKPSFPDDLDYFIALAG